MAYDQLPFCEKEASSVAEPKQYRGSGDDHIAERKWDLSICIPRFFDLRFSWWTVLIAVFGFVLFSNDTAAFTTSVFDQRTTPAAAQHPQIPQHATIETTDHTLVPFEAHIMSKCPDAKDCLRSLVLPAMQQVSPHVNFTLSYIGTPTVNDGVECMHGAEECMGNIIELCAAKLYPDPKIYLGFTMCLTRDFQDIPERELVEDCALEHGIDFATLNTCASSDDGGEGMKMLRDSVLRSSDAGVTTSCTIRVNEEVYCVRDGGSWKSCKNGPGVNDLVIAIEKLYASS